MTRHSLFILVFAFCCPASANVYINAQSLLDKGDKDGAWKLLAPVKSPRAYLMLGRLIMSDVELIESKYVLARSLMEAAAKDETHRMEANLALANIDLYVSVKDIASLSPTILGGSSLQSPNTITASSKRTAELARSHPELFEGESNIPLSIEIQANRLDVERTIKLLAFGGYPSEVIQIELSVDLDAPDIDSDHPLPSPYKTIISSFSSDIDAPRIVINRTNKTIHTGWNIPPFKTLVRNSQ